MLWYLIILSLLIWALLRATDIWNNSKVCLLGKTALITGGNRGLGFQTALGLAARGCRIIIACRSNGEQAKEEIIKLTNNPNILYKFVDFTSFKSIRKLADDINKTEEKIDILINNAGVGDARNTLTEDGYITIYQVNYLSHFLISHLLLDVLIKGKARIINVSSISVIFNKLKLDTLQQKEINPTKMRALEFYGNTKAALYVMTKIMAKKVEKYGLTCNTLHPGCVCTEIFEKLDHIVPKWSLRFFYVLAKYYFKTPEAGVQLILKMAMANEYKDLNGAFLWDFNSFPVSQNLKDMEFAEKLWEKTEEWVQLKENELIK